MKDDWVYHWELKVIDGQRYAKMVDVADLLAGLSQRTKDAGWSTELVDIVLAQVVLQLDAPDPQN